MLIKVPGTVLHQITNMDAASSASEPETTSPAENKTFEMIFGNTDTENLLLVHNGSAQSEFNGQLDSFMQYLKDFLLDQIISRSESSEVNILLILSKL